jgi:hypothetical protein
MLMPCQHCNTDLLRLTSNKLKLKNKGVLAFSIKKGLVVCEMVCPACSKDTEIPVKIEDDRIAKSLSPRIVIRPPSNKAK